LNLTAQVVVFVHGEIVGGERLDDVERYAAEDVSDPAASLDGAQGGIEQA
jgi:hypothetical protein